MVGRLWLGLCRSAVSLKYPITIFCQRRDPRLPHLLIVSVDDSLFMHLAQVQMRVISLDASSVFTCASLGCPSYSSVEGPLSQ